MNTLNGMKMEFDDRGNLAFTDYWIEDEGHRSGAVWVAVRNSVWHILMPDAPVQRLKRALALPVTARSQPQGWQWKLWLKLDINWSIHVPLENFVDGRLPSMPQPLQYYETSLQFYGQFLPGLGRVTHNFGHFANDGLVPRLSCIRLVVGRAGKDWEKWVLSMAR